MFSPAGRALKKGTAGVSSSGHLPFEGSARLVLSLIGVTNRGY